MGQIGLMDIQKNKTKRQRKTRLSPGFFMPGLLPGLTPGLTPGLLPGILRPGMCDLERKKKDPVLTGPSY
jgi:hypothetical protein